MDKVLGIDYGLKKIGLALGADNIVKPLDILKNDPGRSLEKDAIEEITRVILEERISTVILGCIENNKHFDRFVRKLRKKVPVNVPIRFVNEKMTSKDALKKAIEVGIAQKKRKNDHAIAACEIIKRHYESST